MEEKNVNTDYFLWPFYKKLWYNIKNYFRTKISKFKINYTALIIILLIALIGGVLIAIILRNKIDTQIHPRHNRMDTMESIVDHCRVDNNGNFTCEEENNEVVFSNDGYQFKFDLTTTNFTLVDLTTNSEFTSVPKVDGNYINLDTLTMAFYDELGNAYVLGNRSNSINSQSYYIDIDYDNKKIEVFYDFNNKSINDDDFPRGLSLTKYNLLSSIADLAYRNGYENRTFRGVFQSTFNKVAKYTELGYYPRLKGKNGELSGTTAVAAQTYRLFYTYYDEILKEYATSEDFSAFLKSKYRTITEQEIADIITAISTEYPDKTFLENGYSAEVLLRDKEIFDEVFQDDPDAFTEITAIYKERIYIGASIVYELTNSGIDVTIPNDSIHETESRPVVYLELLPYFGANSKLNEGYTMIPDGSGIIIEHNNNKASQQYGPKRIYGVDAANESQYLKETTYDISYPLYGMYQKNADNTEQSFISIVESGAQMAYINAANSNATARNTNIKEYYNYANYRFFLRESNEYVFPDWQNPLTVTARTKSYVLDDFKISYRTLQNDLDYSGMASEYREYLIENDKVKETDTTDELVFNLTLLGGYGADKSIIGIPYHYIDSLTSTDEARIIIDSLLNDNMTNLNILYQGWSNNGVKATSYRDIYFNNRVGSKKDFKSLYEYLSTYDTINFYPIVNLATNYTDKSFSPSKEAIRNSQTGVITFYDFNQATTLQDTTTTPYYYLKPSKIAGQVSEFAKKYNKLGFDNLAIYDLGNKLSGTYNNLSTEFRSDALKAYQDSMEALNSILGEDTKIVSSNPSEYALIYSDLIMNLPTTGTRYVVVDKTIPFTQLLLSGLYDYSSESFNINDKEQFDYHLLKSIETGSNMSFTWSYDRTLKLINTEYNYYYSTYYLNSYDKAKAIYEELSSLDLYKGRLVKHQEIAQNVVASTYLINDTEYITYIINYSASSYSYNGTTVINSMDYIEVGGRI